MDGLALAQEAAPMTDGTLCLACMSTLASCGCTSARKLEAIAVLDAAARAGADPVWALERWRASLAGQPT